MRKVLFERGVLTLTLKAMPMKNCKQCVQQFEVTDEDLEFYDKVSPVFGGKKYQIPPPTLCPDCRYQRRLSWRNEQTLYFRTCDGTGEQIMSAYSSEKPFPIYQSDYWYSDKWDAKEHAQDFDFSLPFFEQYEELMNKVPQLALSVFANENSDFINQAGWNKNCYLIFEADHNENCYYSNFIQESRDCVDTYVTLSSELCYECVNCQNCYNLKFSQNCVTCSDSWFLQDCIGCRNCFGCINLKNKEYYFFNEKCTKEEYEKKLQTMDLNTIEGLNTIREKFQSFALKFPRKYMHGIQNENSTGDYLSHTQNCHDCYSLDHCQDCKFVTDSRNMKNDYDITVFGAHEGAEFSYECHEIGNSVRNICFSDQIWNGVSDVYYSKLCLASSTHLFGCVGLRHSKYCIFNKQYTKEEYEKLVPRIIEHMQKTGEWGEFFPVAKSPYGYNETLAQVFYPLSKEDAMSKGFKWKDEEKISKPQGEPFDVPSTIQEVADDITKQLLTCKTCGDAYKTIAQELQFYRNMGLPIPLNCFKCRHKARFDLRNPRRLWDRKCDKCGVDIKSSYAADRTETVYCEKCYLEAVY